MNGYYTVGQDWERMRTNYLTKFFVLGITFYGLQTVQGPTQSLRAVSQLIHYTDWIPGHVHMGTMGWVTMTVVASIYYAVPKIYGVEIHSEKLANVHFWLVLVGQLIVSISMWITGIQQGALWKVMEGGHVKYRFIDTLVKNYPYYHLRLLGGLLFVAGMLVFIYNVLRTIQNGRAAQKKVAAPAKPRLTAAAPV